MIDDRNPSDDTPARSERTRDVRLRRLVIVTLLLALALAALRGRRREESTLEPPF